MTTQQDPTGHDDLPIYVGPPLRKPGRPKGSPGTLSRPMRYVCGTCENERDKSELLCKRAAYFQMGRGGKHVRTRSLAWICLTCLEEGRDPDWDRVSISDAPGTTNAKAARSDASEER